MLRFLQPLAHLGRTWALWATCALMPSAGFAASTHTAVPHPYCFSFGIADPPKINTECTLLRMDGWSSLRPGASSVAQLSKPATLFAPLKVVSSDDPQTFATFPQSSINTKADQAGHFLSALPNQVIGWGRNSRLTKCCTHPHLRTPRLVSPRRVDTITVLSLNVVFGLMLCCSVLGGQTWRRHPRWINRQRLRRKRRMARPLRLMPRQQVQYGMMAWPAVDHCGRSGTTKHCLGVLTRTAH